ncbi:MAG TPA: glycosyltransferase family 39 protein, partial [Puia sp.]
MKVKSNLFSHFRNLDSGVAALAGFILVQILSKHSGIGVSPDSVTYLSAARHLAAGKGFISFDNFPVVDFPFAYPFFLTIISWITRQDPLQFAPILNGILFGLLLYGSGSIMNGFQKPSGWYKRILLACILMSPALQEVYSLLWSETIFLILILLFIVSLHNYLGKRTTGWLLICAGVAALACLTRYAGVFLLPAGLFLIFFNREIPRPVRLKHCLYFSGISISLFLINILRNDLLTGLAMGQRPKNETGILKILENFGGGFCDWLSLERK